MPLAPDINLKIETENKDIETSKTYALDLKNNRIIGITDGANALEQTIYKIIDTERYQYIIYDARYGIEKEHLFSGNFSEDYIKMEFERVVKDALLTDERILDVTEFEFQFSDDNVYVRFVVDSVFGKLNIERGEKNVV